MEKRLIIGMTKSFLDLKGSKSRSLELDFLRLVYVISSYPEKICKAILIVMGNEVLERVNKNWVSKYEADKFSDNLEIISYEGILKTEYSEFKKNIEEQVKKNRKGNKENSNHEDAIAEVSKELESKLNKYILEKYKPLNLKSSNERIMGIKWDSCFTLNSDFKNSKLQDVLEAHIAEIVTVYKHGRFYIPMVEEISTSENEPTYIGVPGMYGGFSLWKQIVRNETIINSSSWSRIMGGSGKRFILSERACELVEEGFV